MGGLITITSRIVVSSHVTIAGQTAPGQGITVYGNGVSYSGADNTITRYIRYRMGKTGEMNLLSINELSFMRLRS